MILKKKLPLYAATIASVLLVPVAAFAQAANAPANNFDANSMIALAAAISIGLAAIGGTYAQGRATSAALEGIARQPSAAPRIQTPLILGLALIEYLVLFAFVIAFLLQGQIKMG